MCYWSKVIDKFHFILKNTFNYTEFRKNNQLDASVFKIYFCHKNLHVSGIFFTHRQELSTVHTAIYTLHEGYVTAS
jgi:hypothetical protein